MRSDARDSTCVHLGTLNPRDFIRGLKQIEVDLGDVKDALGDVADAGDDALEGLDTREAERGLEDVKDATQDAERALDDLGTSAKGDLSKVETAAKDAGREVESELKDGTGDAEDAFAKLARGAKADMAKVEKAVDGVDDELGDVEDEANASAKEFGASFRGDPVEALEEVQSYLAEIVSVKLPGFAGAAATIAGGAALGLVVAGVEKWREKQERINEIATDYLGIIKEAVDGPLSETNRAYQDLIDKQIVLATLEELSASQLSDIAVLAAARGETAEQYVEKVLKGEVTTQEELARIQAERNDIADELLRITTDNNAENDDQIPVLKAQDAALQEQGEALRAIGGTINENKAGYDKAKAAQDNLGRSTDASKEKQRALNRAAADMRNPIVKNIDSVEDLDDAIDDAADPRKVTITVGDGGSLAKFNAAMAEAVKPAYKTVFVTETRRDAAAASRASTGQQP